MRLVTILASLDGYDGVGDFYDAFANNEDIPFYLENAKRYGSPILDIAAGTCRVSIKLAEAGFEVTALEKSKSMLDTAMRKVGELEEDVANRITIIRGDMQDFSLNQKFSLVIIPFSFGHALTTEAQLRTLRCIRKHLDDDGVFILDLYPGAIQNGHATFEEGPIRIGDGRMVTRRGEIETDFVNQIMKVSIEYEIVQDDENVSIVSVNSDAAIIYNREADILLQVAGFKIKKEFGSYQSSPYGNDSSRRILILKKEEAGQI